MHASINMLHLQYILLKIKHYPKIKIVTHDVLNQTQSDSTIPFSGKNLRAIFQSLVCRARVVFLQRPLHHAVGFLTAGFICAGSRFYRKLPAVIHVFRSRSDRMSRRAWQCKLCECQPGKFYVIVTSTDQCLRRCASIHRQVRCISLDRYGNISSCDDTA